MGIRLLHSAHGISLDNQALLIPCWSAINGPDGHPVRALAKEAILSPMIKEVYPHPNMLGAPLRLLRTVIRGLFADGDACEVVPKSGN